MNEEQLKQYIANKMEKAKEQREKEERRARKLAQRFAYKVKQIERRKDNDKNG